MNKKCIYCEIRYKGYDDCVETRFLIPEDKFEAFCILYIKIIDKSDSKEKINLIKSCGGIILNYPKVFEC
jgi:hypothetical protein